jgi:hypothetical protein
MTDAGPKNMHEQRLPVAREIDDASAHDPYERLAAAFSRVYAETKDIATTLAILDARRPREVGGRPIPDLPAQVLAVAAALFYVRPPSRLLRPGRHRDICSARWIAAWLLRRRRWSLPKIAAFLNVDHSTIVHGLRRVAESRELRVLASDAEATLQATAIVLPSAEPANDSGVVQVVRRTA